MSLILYRNQIRYLPKYFFFYYEENFYDLIRLFKKKVLIENRMIMFINYSFYHLLKTF